MTKKISVCPYLSPSFINENYKIAPYSNYGISKYTCEMYVSKICQENGMSSAILRYFNTYGPNQTFTPYVGIITIFINNMLQQKPITIFGDGNQCRDFIHVNEIVQATVLAMVSRETSGVYNVGTGKEHTVNDIAKILSEKIGVEPVITYSPRRSEELVNSIADISRARDILGFSPSSFFPEKIEHIINSIKMSLPYHG